MKRIVALAAAVVLVLPGPARSWPAAEGLPVPPQQMFEAMLLYAEQGEFDKVGRVLEKMAPLLDEIKAAYGAEPAGEIRKALEKGDAWEAQTAVLQVVYYHMKLELSAALKTQGRPGIVRVRVAYMDYLFFVLRLTRKDKELVAEVERRFKLLNNLVASNRTDSGREDEAGVHVREIERICLLTLAAG